VAASAPRWATAVADARPTGRENPNRAEVITVIDNQPNSAAEEPLPPLSRADIEAWCKEEAREVAARFLGVLHDIAFHYGEDLFAFEELYGHDQAVREVLDVIGRVTNAAAGPRRGSRPARTAWPG
jgi:hypothetical protein